jgi:hypothetical protein
MASRGFYWLRLHLEAGVVFPTSFAVAYRGSPALNIVYFGAITTVGVGCPTSYPMASRGSFVPSKVSRGGVATLGFGFLKLCPLGFLDPSTPNVVSLSGVGFPASFPTTYGGSLTIILASFGGVAMIDVATLGVGFPSCPMVSPGSSVPNFAFCGGVANNGVATPGVGFPPSCPLPSLGPSGRKMVFLRRRNDRHRDALRRFYILSSDIPGSPVVASRRQATMIRRVASRCSASVFQRRYQWHPVAHLC